MQTSQRAWHQSNNRFGSLPADDPALADIFHKAWISRRNFLDGPRN
jgi:hypothetical protein